MKFMNTAAVVAMRLAGIIWWTVFCVSLLSGSAGHDATVSQMTTPTARMTKMMPGALPGHLSQ